MIKGDAIKLDNVTYFEMNDSSVNKSKGVGILLKYENALEHKRAIRLSSTNILHSKHDGLQIFSDTFQPIDLRIDIHKCTLEHNQVGIFMSKMAIDSFDIQKTKCKNNHKGMILRKIHHLK